MERTNTPLRRIAAGLLAGLAPFAWSAPAAAQDTAACSDFYSAAIDGMAQDRAMACLVERYGEPARTARPGENPFTGDDPDGPALVVLFAQETGGSGAYFCHDRLAGFVLSVTTRDVAGMLARMEAGASEDGLRAVLEPNRLTVTTPDPDLTLTVTGDTAGEQTLMAHYRADPFVTFDFYGTCQALDEAGQ
ncbi:MAG: hypothetical protein H6843_09140 [Rhodospirillaceae bacterium]|nr:hypothetical protein [Rhodospirillaceae bacterium]